MTHDTLAVANHFIDLGIRESRPVTPMKLLKLVYIAHGWHLALTGQPLISDRVECWKYGPVIRSLYHEFKGFRGNPIPRPGVSFQTGSGRMVIPRLGDDPTARDLIELVWQGYGHLDGLRLSSLTHEPGTPWDIVWNQKGGKARNGAVIPDELIKDHFDALRKRLAA